ncbi:MAG: hypothetical protein IJ751_07135, partial [Oscillospiraceae bacterium]|nr:hypothetical protein [Oscillospiraceae bacterium]
MKKSVIKRGLALLLTLSLLLTAAACGNSRSQEEVPEGTKTLAAAEQAQETILPAGTSQSEAQDKAETVYVKADPSGHVTEITVEGVLKNPGDGQPIRDRSNLSDLKNTQGDEEFTRSGPDVTWENHGEDIHYKGVSDEPLPVNVTVSYFLDGAPIAPEQLAGRSGQIRIRFDYENVTQQTVTVEKKVLRDDLDGEDFEDFSFDDDADNADIYETVTETVTVPVPFLAITALFLPSDVFYNVEVTNGEVMSSDDQSIVLGCAMPGLADALRLTDYEVTEEVELPDYVELTADVVDFELGFTTTILTNGLFSELEDDDLSDADELVAGAKALGEISDALADGTDELYDGLEEFADILKQYTDGVGALSDGAAQLSGALAQVDSQTQSMVRELSSVQKNLTTLQSALETVVPEELQDPEATAALTGLLTDADRLEQAMTSLQAAMAQAETFAANAENYTQAVSTASQTALQALNAVDLAQMEATARAQVSAALASTSLTAEEQADILNSIDLSTTKADAQAGIDQAKAALATLPTLDIPALALENPEIAALVQDMQTRMDALTAYAEQAQTKLTPMLPDLEEAVAALSEQAQSLSSGDADLSATLTAFSQGMSQLSSGAAALTDGAQQLGSAGSELADGFRDALSGVDELRSALRSFDEEGIQKISDLAGDDLSDVITHVKAL